MLYMHENGQEVKEEIKQKVQYRALHIKLRVTTININRNTKIGR